MVAEEMLAIVMLALSGVTMEPQELVCLSRNIYHEARGESDAGQIAVGYVTLNRVEKPGFGDTICEVVLADRQFSWTHDGKSDTPKNLKAYQAAMWNAISAVRGDVPDPTEGAVYFYNPDVASPRWSRVFAETAVIGGHRFMTD